MTNSPCARTEHQLLESQRAKASPSLADKFPGLRSMTVDLGHFDMERLGRSRQIKFIPNLKFARSVFLVGCENEDCVGGGFNLSHELESAVLGGLTSVTGEQCCQGWRSEATIDRIPCGRILRYTLTLSY